MTERVKDWMVLQADNDHQQHENNSVSISILAKLSKRSTALTVQYNRSIGGWCHIFKFQ